MKFNQVLKFGGVAVVVLIVAVTFVGSEENYKEQIEELRLKYQDNLKVIDDSPFKEQEFLGLKYYEPNSDYVVDAERVGLEDGEILTLATSSGSTQKYVKMALLVFEIQDVKDTLTLLQNIADPSDLFLPFTDETSGGETYGAGRYLPIEPMSGAEIELDFNRAFNPYCAYSDKYSCPMPPRENHIKVAVTAGEKNYHLD